MTLIAAGFVNDHPWLISDVLLSREGGDCLPESPTGSVPTPTETGLIPVDVQRKMVILHEGRMAVAISGLSSHYTKLVHKLRDATSKNPNKKPSGYYKSQLQFFFKSCGYLAPKNHPWQCEMLVGFVERDGSAHIARLDFKEDKIEFDQEFHCASGAEDLKAWKLASEHAQVLEQKGQHGAILKAVMICSILLGGELLSGSNFNRSHGGGYEAVVFDGKRFRSIPTAHVIIAANVAKRVWKVHETLVSVHEVSGGLAISRISNPAKGRRRIWVLGGLFIPVSQVYEATKATLDKLWPEFSGAAVMFHDDAMNIIACGVAAGDENGGPIETVDLGAEIKLMAVKRAPVDAILAEWRPRLSPPVQSPGVAGQALRE